MSFQDLSICGTPTPRTTSRSGRPGSGCKGGSVVTKDQLDIVRKLTFYESEVEKAKAERSTSKKQPVIRGGRSGEQQGVPKLRLQQLRRPNSGSGYHVTRGVDTSRSILSWGEGESCRRAPTEVTKLKLKEEEKEEEEEKELNPPQGSQEVAGETVTSRGGDCEYDPPLDMGIFAFETEEDKLKRARIEKVVDEQMLHDLTLPQSEPETLRTPWATTDRSDFYALKEIPRLRRGQIGGQLHMTSPELTFSHLEKRGMESRVRFSLRPISSSGKDCLRDLHAFYFNTDQSIVVYESKTIGKRVSGVQVYPRRSYLSPEGGVYGVRDLKIGATLVFPKCIAFPADRVLLRVSDIADSEILAVVHGDCRIDERKAREDEALGVEEEEEVVLKRRHAGLVREIQESVVGQLLKRPVRSLLGLSHALLRDEGRVWRADELQSLLRTFRVALSSADFMTLWQDLDSSETGLVDSTLFLSQLLGEMSEGRLGTVRRAWLRMDPSRTAVVSYITVRQFYNPMLTSGDVTKEEMVEEFLENFTAGPLDQRITYMEFLHYHTYLSAEEEDDQVFLAFMRHSWNV